MRTEQRHEFGLEVLQGRHLFIIISHFVPQQILPVIGNLLSKCGLERFFIWWLVKEKQRVGEGILVAKCPDLSKPGVVVVTTGIQNVFGNCVQDVPRKTAYLAKYCELLHVKDGFSRHGARYKEDKWIWSLLMEF